MGTPFEEAAARVAGGADHHAEAAHLVAAMTAEERLGCLDGDTPFWPGLVDMGSGGYYRHTWPAAAVPRLGIPGLAFADGPRGCVVGHATAFPVPMARGATFDPDLETRVGEAIGAELRASGATLTGAVCVNLLRHPAWGRAQETYGEDPHHLGVMGAAAVHGLQRHVLVSVKHVALNSMENARFTVDVSVGERALHEVYLPHFRRAVGAGAASVMSAYNSVNGHWCGEHQELLTTILRDEWGWDGVVISDFVFGLRDAVASVRAGLDVEMPFRQQRAMSLPAAIASGELDATDVDAAATRVVATQLRFHRLLDAASAPPPGVVACDDHRALAREVAVASTVLLTNDGLLPVDASTLRRVAVIGRLAAVANLGDGGSSDVHPPSVVTPLDGLRAALAGVDVVHDDTDASIALGADLAVVVVGYTKADEGEYVDQSGTAPLLFALAPPTDHPELGFGAAVREAPADDRPVPAADASFSPGGDRAGLRLAADDEALVEAVCAANPRTVVAVMAGSAVVVPWIDRAAATLQLWYPGMEGGHALADVLVGRAEPGGRLPFAVPQDESHLGPFDRTATAVRYDELHGQWRLDRDGHEPRFAFGHGLGYTTWALEAAERRGSAVLATVRNTGDRPGSTVLFAFAGVPGSAHERPARRLVGFRRVAAEPGAAVAVELDLDLDLLRVRVDGTWVTEDLPVCVDVGLCLHSLHTLPPA